MKHFTRITFWIVTLACLQASPLRLEETDIPSMRRYVQCPSDSKFYTPKNVEKRCITTALDCVLRELDGTVLEECTQDYSDIEKVADFVEEAIKLLQSKGHAKTNSSECACERWSQELFHEFLNKTESLLGLANTVLQEVPSAG